MTVILIVLIGLVGCSSTMTPPPTPETVETTNPEPSSEPEKVSAIEVGPQVGKLTPDFKFTDAEGKSVSLSDLRGKSIMLNFWATWCGPCKIEMPLIQELAHDKEKADKGLVLLTVNGGESAETVRGFMKKYGFSFPVLLDIQKDIIRAYNVRAIPTTFFIGQDGIIREIKLGAFLSESELEQRLNTVME
jgi:peroxiredoxin